MATRRVAKPLPSAFVVAVVAIGPLNSYSAYFMPEAAYLFMFWVMTWYALGCGANSSLSQWSILGVLVGLLSLIKPHALFLVPALVGYIFLVSETFSFRRLCRSAVISVILVLVLLLSKFLIGYLLAGRAGLTLFGAFYNGTARNSMVDGRLYTIFGFSLTSLRAHLFSLVLLFGLPMAATAALFFGHSFSARSSQPQVRLVSYTFVVLLSLVVVVATYTGSLGVLDASESLRLHQRYYDFALPLLFMVAACIVSSPLELGPRGRFIYAALTVLALALAVNSHMRGYRFGVLDGPFIWAVSVYPFAMTLLGLLMILLMVFWTKKPSLAFRGFLYVLLPAIALFSAVLISREFYSQQSASIYDRAGIYARSVLSGADLAALTVICAEPGGSFRALFYVDDARANFVTVPEGQAFSPSSLSNEKKWLLIIGEHAVAEGEVLPSPTPGFHLVRLRKEISSQ
jgi:phosphoglycerol transferase